MSDPSGEAADSESIGGGDDPSLEELRERVEAEYDFEDFSPADMAEMSPDEWQAAFDPDTWITGSALLDRVYAELRKRVADRQLFAVVERLEVDGEDRVAAYSDEGYALVAPDGTVTGEGMVHREVKPIVALCAMESFDPGPGPDADGPLLPDPDDVDPGTSSLGDRLVIAIAVSQLLAGVAILVLPLLFDLPSGGGFLTIVVGLAFLVIGLVLGVLVANARLSGRFRAEEYRERLRAAGVGSEGRPAFLPFEDDVPSLEGEAGARETGEAPSRDT